jgi:hypothetical protein
MQYYVLTQQPEFKQIVTWLTANDIPLDIHLNRTRFSIDKQSSVYTEFCLRYSDICPLVDPARDLATGLPNIHNSSD